MPEHEENVEQLKKLDNYTHLALIGGTLLGDWHYCWLPLRDLFKASLPWHYKLKPRLTTQQCAAAAAAHLGLY